MNLSLFLNYVVADNAYLFSIDVPYSYLWTVGELIVGMGLFLLVCRYLLPYFARLVVTQDGVYLIGHRVKIIPKAQIAELQTVKWNLALSSKSFGLAILFWKPLLKIILNNGKQIYIRSHHAEHLKQDLQRHLKLESSNLQ